MTTGDAVTVGRARDRLLLGAMLAALAIVAAVYIVMGVGIGQTAIEMTRRVGAPLAAPGKTGVAALLTSAWTPGYFLRVSLLWWSISIAITTPAVGRDVLHHAEESGSSRLAAGCLFVAGFLAVLAGFGLAATTLQWVAEMRGMISATGMVVTHPLLAGAILVAVGLYQFSKLKHECLTLTWRTPRRRAAPDAGGRQGSYLSGLKHGGYCLGWCGPMFLLLFFGGVMNLFWIGALLLAVLVEKLVPRGESVGLGAGAVLMLWGILFLISATGIL